jgi:hypothetical protein
MDMLHPQIQDVEQHEAKTARYREHRVDQGMTVDELAFDKMPATRHQDGRDSDNVEHRRRIGVMTPNAVPERDRSYRDGDEDKEAVDDRRAEESEAKRAQQAEGNTRQQAMNRAYRAGACADLVPEIPVPNRHTYTIPEYRGLVFTHSRC